MSEKKLETLDEAEKRLLQESLKEHDWNVSKAADAIGMSRATAHRRINAWGLERPEKEADDGIRAEA